MLRKIKDSDINEVYKMGYIEWGEKRPYYSYEMENKEEDKHGTRYVYEVEGKIVSSFMLYYLENLSDKLELPVYGIASVVTKRKQRGKGFAKSMLQEILSYKIQKDKNTCFMLYSEIDPSFYEKLGFRDLPYYLQKHCDIIAMARCNDTYYDKIKKLNENDIPKILLKRHP